VLVGIELAALDDRIAATRIIGDRLGTVGIIELV